MWPLDLKSTCFIACLSSLRDTTTTTTTNTTTTTTTTNTTYFAVANKTDQPKLTWAGPNHSPICQILIATQHFSSSSEKNHLVKGWGVGQNCSTTIGTRALAW